MEFIRLCEERNPNLSTKFDFYTLLNIYFYWIRLFVSAVYKSPVPSYHWLLVIEAADGAWILVSPPVWLWICGRILSIMSLWKWLTSDRTIVKWRSLKGGYSFVTFYPNQKPLGLSLLALKYILLSWNLWSPNLSFFVKRIRLLVLPCSVIRRMTGFVLGQFLMDENLVWQNLFGLFITYKLRFI